MARKKSIKPFPDRKPTWVVTAIPHGSVRSMAMSDESVFSITDPREIGDVRRVYGITRAAKFKWFDYTYLLATVDADGEIQSLYGVRVPPGGGLFDGAVDRIVWGWTDSVMAKRIANGEIPADRVIGALCTPSDGLSAESLDDGFM